MKTHYQAFTLSLIILICIGWGWLLWAVLLNGHGPWRPLDIIAPVTTDRQMYSPGDEVHAKIAFCKYYQVAATVQWSLVDNYLKLYPAKTADVGVGCRTIDMLVETIPPDAHPDTYHFEGIVTYRYNDFNSARVFMRTNDFKVK